MKLHKFESHSTSTPSFGACGRLLLLVLLLVLPLVVSPNPGRPNEAITRTATGSSSSPAASCSIPGHQCSLIAEEKQEQQDDKAADQVLQSLVRRQKRRALGGTTGAEMGLFAAAHQQSTNAAAARRDLQHKQPRRYDGAGRTARGAAPDSKTLIANRGAEGRLAEKRALAEEINGLGFALDEKAHQGRDGKARSNVILAALGRGLPTLSLLQRRRKEFSKVSPELTKSTMKSIDEQMPDSMGIKAANLSLQNIEDKNEFNVGVDSKRNTSGSNKHPSLLKNGLSKEIASYALYHRISDDEMDDNPILKIPTKNNFSSMNPFLLKYQQLREYNNSKQKKNTTTAQSHRKNTGTLVNVVPEASGRYEFGYRVLIDRPTASDYGHKETRNGFRTSGQYHVLLPDGRVQRVRYLADRNGYRAEVSYVTSSTSTDLPSLLQR